MAEGWMISPTTPVLVTGAGGFIGPRVVEKLLERGLRRVRCLVRPSSNLTRLQEVIRLHPDADVAVIKGNLLSRDDCATAAEGAVVIYHLVMGSEKSYAGTFLNTVVTTRNLLDAIVAARSLQRFVNVSSFAVYNNQQLSQNSVLDETCALEADPRGRHDPYCYAKYWQEELLKEVSAQHGFSYAIVRPGVVFGEGARLDLHTCIGLGTFGVFLHLGGSNQVPLTYVDNCADAIVLAGLVDGAHNQAFNIVDDDLPSSRAFLRKYKNSVRKFRSLYVPYPVFYAFCYLWEQYAHWSRGQLPPVFNRRMCENFWKGNRYSNHKAKRLLGWQPQISTAEGIRRHCEYFAKKESVR
jgi:nucleoside-diphosphate-sugar epimerase